MGCPFLVTTIEDASQIVGWIMTTLLVFQLSTFTSWNPQWFVFLRRHLLLPTEKAAFSGLTVLAMANGWAAWRLWVCENWDVDPVPLFLYLLMIIVSAMFLPILMLTPKNVYLPLLVGVISFALAIAFTVFAFFDDMWAGLIGIVNILLTLLYIIIGVQIWMIGNLYTKFDTMKGKIEDKSLRGPDYKFTRRSVAPVSAPSQPDSSSEEEEGGESAEDEGPTQGPVENPEQKGQTAEAKKASKFIQFKLPY